ncbi:MAG: enoyl-CoA hydratase/isomerase family protein [Alphaproteobacteria bacterium]|nr:enoyl-CoA hydratase/isomerase family protein [Alphaproteobacteria bacterium]
MSEEVLIGREGAMGVITLNRPGALNALSHAMIDTIYRALTAWRNDDGVAAVLLEGNGARAFCAGGDVRATRQAILDGRVEEGLSFYADEYRNNRLIATYPKPVVAFGHGFVMGGGIGLAGHASLRIAVEGAQYAMPESAIGLFCDVGVNARLALVPAHRALLFELCGLPVGPADAIALNLADLMVPQAAVADLRAALIATADAGVDTLKAEAEGFAREPGAAAFAIVADRLAPAMTARSAATLVATLHARALPQDEALIGALDRRCPTSLEAILQAYWLAYEDPHVAAVLDRDLRLARYLSVRDDFVEGVRAVLVDKDNRPAWSPSEAAAVDSAAITAALAGGTKR